MAIIKSKHQPFFTWFFRVYSKQMMRWHFRKVTFHGTFHDQGLPVLLIGNHFSWWDGFIANLLNSRVFHRKFHVMMLEEQLSKRKFLNKAGAYSIKKGSRSVIESLQYTVDLMSSEDNLVVLYPQGEFESIYRRPVRFEKGISTIAPRVQKKFQLVFYAALVDYFSHRNPSITIYLLEVPQELALTTGSLESAYNEFFSGCIMRQKPE
jgi:1-acyl-sn-glycerol-3-phosphate acyltransferase